MLQKKTFNSTSIINQLGINTIMMQIQIIELDFLSRLKNITKKIKLTINLFKSNYMVFKQISLFDF